MKVWVLEHYSYGETYIFDESTNLLAVPIVKAELEALGEDYADERDAFIAAVTSGETWAYVEERFDILLQEVKHYD